MDTYRRLVVVKVYKKCHTRIRIYNLALSDLVMKQCFGYPSCSQPPLHLVSPRWRHSCTPHDFTGLDIPQAPREETTKIPMMIPEECTLVESVETHLTQLHERMHSISSYVIPNSTTALSGVLPDADSIYPIEMKLYVLDFA